MQAITIGKYRGLQQCCSERGTLTCLALDHRQNLRKANPRLSDDHELSCFKLDIAGELAPFATALLLDPEVSAAQAVAGGATPGNVGLVVALESTGYSGEPSARQGQIIPGWSVEKAKRMGASMVKLLVYYHPDSTAAPEIEAFVTQVAADCQAVDLGLMLEPLSYPLDEARLSSQEKRYVVVETARRLTAIAGVDVLKAELPLDSREIDPALLSDACAELSSAARIPWILLSAAAFFETYLLQAAAACQQGASGLAVGRAVWQEAVTLDPAVRGEFLRCVARPRLVRLNELCRALARPVSDFYHAAAPLDWYKTY